MSKSNVQKAWSRPQLVRLGTIGDVAATTSLQCQVQGNSQCNGSNSVKS